MLLDSICISLSFVFEKRLFVIVRDVNDFAKRIGCIIEYKYTAFGSVDVAGNVELQFCHNALGVGCIDCNAQYHSERLLRAFRIAEFKASYLCVLVGIVGVDGLNLLTIEVYTIYAAMKTK